MSITNATLSRAATNILIDNPFLEHIDINTGVSSELTADMLYEEFAAYREESKQNNPE